MTFDDDDNVMIMNALPSIEQNDKYFYRLNNYVADEESKENSNKHDGGYNNRNSYNYIIDNDDLPVPLLQGRHHDGNELGARNRIDQEEGNQSVEQNYRQRQRQEQPKLNGLNYLNCITYVLNVFTSYFIGVRGLFGVLPTRRDIFIEYETLVTPADYAFYIWAPILIFEFFFATAQLLPHYRARSIIQQGTGLYFFWACIIQTIWTVFFALKWFVLSFVAVCLALLCLAFLLASQHYNCLCMPATNGGISALGFPSASVRLPPTTYRRRRRNSVSEYCFFRFPFYLHCGWLLVCMVVQFSMVFRYRFTPSSGAQLMSDIVSLGVLLPPSTFFLTGQSSGPDFVIPAVIIWSYISIGVELQQPSDTLVALYGHPAILAVQNAAYVFAGIIIVMLVPRIVIWIFQEFCTIDVVELIEEEDDDINSTINEVRRGFSSPALFHRFSIHGHVTGETSYDQSIDNTSDDDVNANSGAEANFESLNLVKEEESLIKVRVDLRNEELIA